MRWNLDPTSSHCIYKTPMDNYPKLTKYSLTFNWTCIRKQPPDKDNNIAVPSPPSLYLLIYKFLSKTQYHSEYDIMCMENKNSVWPALDTHMYLYDTHGCFHPSPRGGCFICISETIFMKQCWSFEGLIFCNLF